MSAWPPPPDLASIAELVRAADPEGHLAEGAPADEYEPEEEEIYAALHGLPTAGLTAEPVLEHLVAVWRASFQLTPEQVATRLPALRALAQQIERFFGPQAEPQTRNANGPAA